MITRDEAYDIVFAINESAHDRSWDTWTEADNLADSDNEEDWDQAEELREQASAEQASYFREEFGKLDEPTQKAVLHYVNTDTDFRDEFVAWYGEDDFEADHV